MGKRLSIKPLETLTLEIRNKQGELVKEVDFTFNNYASMVLAEEFGDLVKLTKRYDKNPYDLAAILLYSGVKPNDSEFELDDAKSIIASGGKDVFEEIMKLTTDSLVSMGGPEVEKKFLAEMKKLKKNTN